MRRVISVLAVLVLLLASCASDPTASEEYQDLEQQLAKVEQMLEDATAERDALAARPVSNPAESFDFETDDLCTWVSAEEVGEFVEEALGWEVVAVDLYTPPFSDGWDCEWKLTDSDGGRREVAAEEVDWGHLVPSDIHGAMTQDVVDFADTDEALVPWGATVSGHPSLREGVLVHNGGYGQFAFGVPPRDQYLQVSVVVPDDENWEEYEPKFLAVANRMIEALGWLPDN